MEAGLDGASSAPSGPGTSIVLTGVPPFVGLFEPGASLRLR
jgi:hypothetical protein